MARSNKKPKANTNPNTTPTPGTAVAADELLALLRDSTRRTAAAMVAPDVGGFESVTNEPVTVSGLKSPRLLGNSAEAIARRLRRLGKTEGEIEEVLHGQGDSGFESTAPAVPPVVALERIIGKDMLLEVCYLEAGRRAARPVGRVVIRDPDGTLLGHGTGFLVAPRLLLTNHHVIPSASVAGSSRVEFNYERDLDGRLDPRAVVRFDLDPQAFYVSSPVDALDFTLVAVKETSTDGQHTLDEFGRHSLSAVEDEVLAGECVTIIQHPRGDPKQVALRENEVVKLPDPGGNFLHYQTDTHPGSSGSPVFNNAWEVVALHHAGKPATDDHGNYLATDGTAWTPEHGLDALRWEANEGVRVAAIVAFVKSQPLTAAQQSLFAEALHPAPRKVLAEGDRPWDSIPIAGDRPEPSPGPTVLLNSAAEPPPALATAPAPVPAAPGLNLGAGGVTFTIPLEVTVRLGGVAGGVTASRVSPPTGAEEAIRIDPDYSNREGYDPEFLGGGALRIPLPKMPQALEAQAAVNTMAGPDLPPYELPYHHFSVVLHRTRRLAIFTAVNIDGRFQKSPERERDVWSYDPRVGREVQVGNEFYVRPYDRGHLVRRLDPAWGKSPTIIRAANDDTFHWSNCSPQHSRFNEGKNLWAGLEDYLMNTATGGRKRLTVFTGPVFAKTDPFVRGVQVPLRFWKVAATTKADGKLAATAYLVSQADLVKPTLEEMAAADVARTFQVGVRKVERLTGLDFGRLHDADPTATLELTESADGDGAGRALLSYKDIMI
jgi:endonuclease G